MDIKKVARKNILELKPYTCARDSFEEGLLLDANENAFGSVISDEENLELNRYPDPHQKALKSSLGEYLGVDTKNLFFGVGSDEIIDLLIKIFCEPNKDNALLLEPTYGMYKVACDVNSVVTKAIPLNKEFDVDPKTVKKNIDQDTKIIFLCSPNNPTGNVLSKDNVLAIAKSFSGVVVIDEAYIDFDERYTFQEYVKEFNNIVILRTFSKAWGMAGVRCGYCVADSDVIDLLFKVKAPYTINKLTENAILKAIANNKLKRRYVWKIREERQKVALALSSYEGIEKVYNSNANYILFKCKNAKEVFNKLAAKGVIIRDRSNQLNLEGCLRVTIGTKEQNNLFLKEIQSVLCS